jgi:hypothetical protein
MFNLVPGRFAEPKWQAYVTPDTQSFVFTSGRKIRSLYDLKIALSEESEEEIHRCINDGHLLASWVRNAIKDESLATEFEKTQHRWGMIVTLERHMMRSLSLPDYVAQRWLEPTDIKFTFVSGQTADSLQSLAIAMKEVSDETISFHRERVPNDISKWIMDILGDYQVAELLEEAANRTQMLHFLEDHIAMLTECLHTD